LFLKQNESLNLIIYISIKITYIDLHFHIPNIQSENYLVAEYRNWNIEYTVKYTITYLPMMMYIIGIYV